MTVYGRNFRKINYLEKRHYHILKIVEFSGSPKQKSYQQFQKVINNNVTKIGVLLSIEY